MLALGGLLQELVRLTLCTPLLESGWLETSICLRYNSYLPPERETMQAVEGDAQISSRVRGYVVPLQRLQIHCDLWIALSYHGHPNFP